MSVCKVLELFRLRAVDGDSASESTSGPVGTLLVYNPLAAPVYIGFGSSVPSAAAHDVACPGESILQWPISGVDTISAVVDYPGAVPATDVGRVIVRVIESTQPAFVGPLAL
jgi:hypothetical protein